MRAMRRAQDEGDNVMHSRFGGLIVATVMCATTWSGRRHDWRAGRRLALRARTGASEHSGTADRPLVRSRTKHGGLGGELVGSGAGGLLLFYAEEPRHVQRAMTGAGLPDVRSGFDRDGSDVLARS